MARVAIANTDEIRGRGSSKIDDDEGEGPPIKCE
jgi:hypothetical protein